MSLSRCQLPVNCLLKLGSEDDAERCGSINTHPRMCHHHRLHNKHSADPRLSSTAYWIAFGPHGPRAEPPAGEGRKVALYTAVAVGVSFIIFASMRMFANPAPHTMTREWQEASNEYLKVRSYPSTSRSYDAQTKLTRDYRAKEPTPSPVSRPRATRARARSSRLPRELNRSGGFTLLIERGWMLRMAGAGPCTTKLELDGRRTLGACLVGGVLQKAEVLVWCIYCTTTTMQHPFSLSHILGTLGSHSLTHGRHGPSMTY